MSVETIDFEKGKDRKMIRDIQKDIHAFLQSHELVRDYLLQVLEADTEQKRNHAAIMLMYSTKIGAEIDTEIRYQEMFRKAMEKAE